jgi:L-rhamnose mutarotase
MAGEETPFVRRYGFAIQLKPERAEEYLRLHEAVWPEVQARMAASHIRNYTIFYFGGWLFNYWEYTGQHYEENMAAIEADPSTQKWWALTMPCQQPVEGRQPGEWWAKMDEVYHQD